MQRLRIVQLVHEPDWPIGSWYRERWPPRLLDPTHGLGFYLAAPPPIIEETYLRLQRTLDGYASFCRQRRIELIVSFFPQRFQVQADDWERAVRAYGLKADAFDVDAPNRRILELCRSSGIRCLDPTNAMRRRYERHGEHLYLPRGDMHWNRLGHEAFHDASIETFTALARGLTQARAR